MQLVLMAGFMTTQPASIIDPDNELKFISMLIV